MFILRPGDWGVFMLFDKLLQKSVNIKGQRHEGSMAMCVTMNKLPNSEGVGKES